MAVGAARSSLRAWVLLGLRVVGVLCRDQHLKELGSGRFFDGQREVSEVKIGSSMNLEPVSWHSDVVLYVCTALMFQ